MKPIALALVQTLGAAYRFVVTALVLYGAIMLALNLWTLWTGNNASIGLGNVCIMLRDK